MIIVHKSRVPPETEDGRTELVVHRRVPLIAQRPGRGHVPLFTDNIGVRIGAADGRAEPFPITVIRIIGHAGVNVAGHIQPPAICILHPKAGNSIRAAIVDKVAYLLVAAVQLGQTVKAKPGFIRRVTGAASRSRRDGRREEIPVPVLAGFAFASAIRSRIPVVAVKIDAVGRSVVKHTIQDDVDAPVVRFRHQCLEEGQIAKVVINHAVISRVIFVIGWRLENGVHINDRDAQILQVIQFIQNALQIAAVEVLAVNLKTAVHVAGIAEGRVPIGSIRADDAAAGNVVMEAAGRGVIGRIAIPEPFREYLVHDAVLDPIGCLEGGIVHGKLPAIVRAAAVSLTPTSGTAVVIFVVGGAAAILGNEAVPVNGGLVADGQRGFPVVILTVAGGQGHVQNLLRVHPVIPDAYLGIGQIVTGGTETQGYGRARGHCAAGCAV